MDIHQILARLTDKNGIDPDHLDTSTTNATLIAMQRKYCTLATCPLSWGEISYLPNVGGNVFYLICFVALLGVQLFFGIRHKTWSYLWPMVVGLLLEIIGYIGRLLLHSNPFLLGNFLAYLIPLTIGPAFFTAAIYISLGRTVQIIGPEYSRLSPTLYTYIFVGLDLLALVLQATGGGLAATAKDHAGSVTGAHVMVAGLASQVVSMVFFMMLFADFAFRARTSKRATFLHSQALYGNLIGSRTLALFQVSLAVSTVLIFIRCAYRVAELKDGFTSSLANDETAFMILEGPMIILAVLALSIWHPGRALGVYWVSEGKNNGARSNKPAAAAIELLPQDDFRYIDEADSVRGIEREGYPRR